MSREILRAILKNDPSTLDALLRDGGDIGESTDAEKWNYLHRALMSPARPASVDMVRKLIASGVDVDAVDIYGNTPIHYAVRTKRPELVQVLVDAGAKVDVVNKEGVTPLRQALAAKPFDHESMRVLIRAGADVHQGSPHGPTVREHAEAVANGDAELLAVFGLR